jgi:5-methylcytosine-specific restriction enzyme A
MKIEVGKEYKRSQLHDAFGGNRQGGIASCAKADIVFLFTGETGEQYGYSDGWDGEYFMYTGEGQAGDMVFARGNAAVRDHEQNGKRLILMQTTRPTFVEVVGEFACVDYEYFEAPDKGNMSRRAIRFVLEKAVGSSSKTSQSTSSQPSSRHKKPTKTESKGLVTSRVGQGWYRQELLSKFGRKCAVTESSLEEILIASHIVPWRDSSDDEKLDPNNGILLSPNYDALFDKHFISFDDLGNIIISSVLSSSQVSSLCISTAAQIEVSELMKPYLARHREKLR